MLRNHLRVTWRNLNRHRGFSFISIASLALSLSVCLLLVLIVHHQRSFDRHHPDTDRLYRVLTTAERGDYATSPAPMGRALAERFAGIDGHTRVQRLQTHALVEGGGIAIDGDYTEPSYFDLFHWPVRAGGSASALAEPYQILLSAELAERLFPGRNPVGSVIELQELGDFTIAGILEPTPGPTHLRAEFLASYATLEAVAPERVEAWRFSMWRNYTYVRLSPAVRPDQLQPAFASISEQHFSEDEGPPTTFRLQPVTAIAAFGPMLSNEMRSGILPREVGIFLALLMAIVLLAACFTFTNLSLARAMERAKEVGVRKTLGARRSEIAGQFIVEAVVLAFLALGAAVLLLPLLVAGYNGLSIVQRELIDVPIEPFQPAVLALFVAAALLTGLLAGFYPALALSRPRPIEVMAARLPGLGGRGRLRRVLLGAQLFLSFVLIVSALLLHRQSEFMRTADYGFDTERLVYVETRGAPAEVLKQELAGLQGVEGVAGLSPHLPLSGSVTTWSFRAEGTDASIEVRLYRGDEHVLDVLGVPLVAGTLPVPAEQPSEIIVNEMAATALGARQPAEAVGMVLPRGSQSYEVRGVMADFATGGLEQPLAPAMMMIAAESPSVLLVRSDPAHHAAVLEHLAARWADLDPVYPLEAGRYSAVIGDQVNFMRDLMGLVGAVGLFALLIVGMGLLGVAAYSMQVRTKEVGIRKVLGASVPRLALLLSREFLWLAGLALAVGLPVSWLLNSLWLELFVYRIDVGAGVFMLAALALALVLLGSVGVQALRAAHTDPVRDLRSE
jgi:putative ABC transport system permease protein